MGWNSQVVIAQQVFIEGTGDGLFIYNGAPELGNLIGSWTATAGTDPYGNAYVAGITATQGVLNGILINTSTLVNALIQNGTLTGGAIQSAAISSGTITESVITFDSTAGALLAYVTTTTTTTESTDGNYQFTPGANVTQARIQCWGAGAGGDGGNSGTGGNGGGGGEYAEEPAYPLVPGQVYNYVVGNGGTGAISTQGHGGDGGDTYFDSGGVLANGGDGARTGGTGSTNTIHFNGGTGGNSGAGDTGAAGGGGSAGSTGAGGNGVSATGATGQNGGAAGTGGGAAGGKGGSNGANGSNGSAPGAGGGGAGAGGGSNTFSKTYTATSSASYQGSDGTNPNQKINNNGSCYQGGDVADTFNGKAKSFWAFNTSQIQSDLSSVTLTSVKVTLNNNHSWYDNGMTVALGSSLHTSFPATVADPGGGDTDVIEYFVSEGATLTKDVSGTNIGTNFQSGACNCLLVFKNSNDLHYYGFFAGASQSGPAQIQFNGTTGSGSTSAGNGADGQVKITYTSGSTLAISISPVSGTDVFSNSYPAGIATSLPLQITDQSAPSAVSGAAVLYAATGNPKYISGLSGDGNAYNMGQLSVTTPGQTSTATSGAPATVTNWSVAVGIGTYSFHAWFTYKGGSAAGTPSLIFSGPAESAFVGGISWFENGLSSVQSGSMVYGGSGSTGPTFETSFEIMRFDAYATFTAAGTVTIQIYTSNSADSFIVQGGVLEVLPVA